MADYEVGRAVTARLAEMGVTQRQMAGDLGLSEVHVSRILTGRVSGKIGTVSQLLDYVGLQYAIVPKEESTQ